MTNTETNARTFQPEQHAEMMDFIGQHSPDAETITNADGSVTVTIPECDCSHEYGPCEQHGTVLAQREGASTRTADELCIVYIEDAVDLGAELSLWGQDVYRSAVDNLETNRSMGVAWFSDDEEGAALHDDVRSLVNQVEASLDAWTIWEDGYRIVSISDDCPLV